MFLLEKFLIEFVSDSSNVEEGAKRAKKSTDDLEKNIKATDKATQNLGRSFTNVIKQAAGYFTSLLAVGSITAGVMSAARYANQLHDLSEALGVNIVKLDLWGNAAKKSGGTVEGFQQSIKTLSGELTSFSTKGTSLIAPFFQQLGIRMTDSAGKARDVFDILPELADKFSALGKQQSFGIGKKLGLDQGTITLLQQGRRAVDDLIKKQRELGFVTKRDGEIAAEFHLAWDDATHAMRSLFLSLNRAILPILNGLTEGFQKAALFFRKYSGLIEGTFFLLTALAGAFALSMVVANAAIIGVTLVIAALAAAFVIAYDDIKNFMEGNESFIGQMLEKWPMLRPIVEGVIAAFKHLFDVLMSIPEASRIIWDALKALVNWINDIFVGAIDKISNAVNKIKSFLGFSDKNLNTDINLTKQSLINASAFPGAAANTTSLMNRFNNRSMAVSTGPINIQTQATDPQGISNAIGQSLNTQLRQAVNNFDDGVAA